MSDWSRDGLRARNGGESWPTQWDHADRWPRLENEPWIPDFYAAVIVCMRGQHDPMVIVSYESPAEAREADALLYDKLCGPDCQGQHYRVWTEPGRLHVAKGVHDPVPVLADLAAELRRCYPRR